MKHNSCDKILVVAACFLLLVGCSTEKHGADDASAQNAVVAIPAASTEMVHPKHAYDPDVVNFSGFGPAKFGSNEESVRMSWGRPLNASQPIEGSTCLYLNPETLPDAKRGIGFMLEEGKFVRYDIGDASQIAPGNFKVGDDAGSIKAAFVGRIEEAPHKYLPKGFTLTVTPEDKSNARLVFEIGEDGKVSTWRIGLPPQVYYVEGCG